MAKKLKQGSGSGQMVGGVNLSEVERLLSFMESHGLEEFEYQEGGVHVRLKKAAAHGGVVAPAFSAAAPATPQASSAAQPQAHTAPSSAAQPAEDLHIVKSPIVGTFYAAPSPDAEPFVTVGSRIDAGQVLCIIEAMKLMNEIEADISGEVARVFVENGHPVEYGQQLFGIRTHGKK